MTTEQKLENVCAAGESMRKLQNLYFKEKNQATKADWLRRAKEAEQRFDQLLREVRQRSLFSETGKERSAGYMGF
jgi:hypothetical protein